MNERKMMNLLKKQEKRALEWLYEQYSPFIYGTIRRIGKTDEVVEQLLVKTFMKAWSEVKTIDVARYRALPWVFNILIDTIIEHVQEEELALETLKIGELKLELDSSEVKYKEQLLRLERVIEQNYSTQQPSVIDFTSDDTKLQQSILALRARLKINQVLMPR